MALSVWMRGGVLLWLPAFATAAGDGARTLVAHDRTWTAGHGAEAHCGDAIVQQFLGELCDDGNQLDGDGCSALCEVEDGFTCSVYATASEAISELCTPICGDGLVRGDEVCDDGNADPEDGCACTTQNASFSCLPAGLPCVELPTKYYKAWGRCVATS